MKVLFDIFIDDVHKNSRTEYTRLKSQINRTRYDMSVGIRFHDRWKDYREFKKWFVENTRHLQRYDIHPWTHRYRVVYVADTPDQRKIVYGPDTMRINATPISQIKPRKSHDFKYHIRHPKKGLKRLNDLHRFVKRNGYSSAYPFFELVRGERESYKYWTCEKSPDMITSEGECKDP